MARRGPGRPPPQGRQQHLSVTTRRVAAVLSVTAAVGAFAPVASAEAGLLDGILSPSTPSTSTVDANVVSSLVTVLDPATSLGGPQLTSVVTNFLASGVPADAAAIAPLLTQVTTVLGNGGDPAALVSGLLGQGLAAGEIVPLVDELLAGVVDPSATVTAVVGQLLAAGLPTDAAGLDAAGITSLLGALQGGAAPTGDLLGPVTGLLDTVAANTALPADVRTALAGLSSTVKTVGGSVLSDDLLGQVNGVLGSLVGSAALSGPVKDALSGLTGLLVPGKTPAATPKTTITTTTPAAVPPVTVPPRRGTLNLKDLTATVSSLKVDKARKTLTAKVTCPKKSFVPCTVKSLLSVDGLRSGKATKTTLKAGQSKTIKIKLASAGARKLARRGGKVTVKATSSHAGYTLGSASKAVKVEKAKKAAKR